MSSANTFISANLSQAIWTLWSTPMVPAEPKSFTNSFPMVDLSKKRGQLSHSRGSISTVDNDACGSTSGASVASSTSSFF